MTNNKNISRDEIAESINKEFGFNKRECLEVVNNIINIKVEGLNTQKIVKIHNFGTFKLNKKNSRIGRNPKTKEEYTISSRYVVAFKASRHLLNFINNKHSE